MITSPFDPTIIKVNLATVTLFGTWFAYWYKSGLARSERERAYVCSLLSSFICSLSSLPLVYTFIKSHGDVNELLIYREWTVIITSFFMTFLVMDLAIGMFYYRAKIDLLTGWIHHITYLGVLSWAIANQYCGVFVTLCVLEIPTCVLALGSVRSTLRRDYVFASSFFATRIVFHLYTMVHIWKFQSFGPVFSAVAAFFPVHCYWFYGFIQQQIRLSKAKKSIKKLSNEEKSQQLPFSGIKKNNTTSFTTTTTTIRNSVTVKARAQQQSPMITQQARYNIPIHHSPPVSVH